MQRFHCAGSHDNIMIGIKKSMPLGFHLLFFLLVSGICCTRNYNSPVDNGCISQVISNPSQSSLAASQVDSIETLFSKNNLSTSGLQFIEYVPDIYGSPAINPQSQTQVTAHLFLNGLPVYGINELFIFNGGIFDTAYLYTGHPANNNENTRLPLDSLRKDFLQHVSQSDIYGGASGKPFIPSATTYLDSCLDATLGYVDATSVPGQTLPYGNLIKVWTVTTLHNSYPCVMVEDDNGLAWGVSIYVP
jgi:hypothetical protein